MSKLDDWLERDSRDGGPGMGTKMGGCLGMLQFLAILAVSALIAWVWHLAGQGRLWP